MLKNSKIISYSFITFVFVAFAAISIYSYDLEKKENHRIKTTEISTFEYKRIENALKNHHYCKASREATKSALEDEQITIFEKRNIIQKIKTCISNKENSELNAEKQSSIENLKAISDDSYRPSNSLTPVFEAYIELLDTLANDLNKEIKNN